MPEEISPEEEEELESLFGDFEEQILRFSEDYVDLIGELEFILQEFDEFFEEFGQISIREYEKALERLQSTLSEEYSSENYQQMMEALDNLLAKFKDLEMELEESNSSVEKRRLRTMRALEDDLEDIREQLEEEVDDSRILSQIDTEALAEIITKSIKEAQKAMVEAEKAYKENLRLMETPAPPRPPKGIKDGTGNLGTLNTREFSGTLTKSATAEIASKSTAIELENAIGGIEVETWNRSEISIEMTIGYIEDSKESRGLAEEIKLAIDQSPELVKARVLYPGCDEKPVNIVASRLNISLPRANRVKITNSFGQVFVAELDNDLNIKSNFSEIEVRDINGRVVVTNSSGSIYLENIDGELEATNSFAPIELAYINGQTKLSNSYAPVRVEKSAGGLNINTSGDVYVDHYRGDASVHSSNGRMELYDINGNLVAINSFGPILAEKISGDAKIENANAQIEISGVEGALLVSNNFAPVMIDEIGSDVTVKSSNGNITIENIKAGVNVVNRFGEVSIQSVAGKVMVTNSGEPVTISEVLAPVTVVNQFSPVMLSTITGEVNVDNMNASVNLTDIKGASRVKTSFGLISGENLGGPFILKNDNGSIELLRVLNINSDCEATTTYGDITLELPQLGLYNLNATTSYGEIDSDVPLNVTSSGNVTSGAYIAGQSNPTITLTGSNSSIKIRTE
jgi:hypothetical protein